MKKLVVITTHPIQYYAPIFKLLDKRLDLLVLYTWGEDSIIKFDPGFGKFVEWDLPLLDGYRYEFLRNISKKPGSTHFFGIDNPDIIKIINSFNPSAILVIGWAYRSHLEVIRYFSGRIKLLFRGDSNLLDFRASWKNWLRNFFLKWLYGHIDHALYVGNNNRDYYLAVSFPNNRLHFSPHAVDNKRFERPRGGVEVNKIRFLIDANDDDNLILFAGKFEPKKNPILLLQTFLQLDLPNTRLLLVGNGKLEDEMKRLANGHKRVHFFPFQNQSSLPDFYHASDLFCLPSLGPGETWGLAVNEAMAAGNAILCSDKVGCAVDLVKEGVNGYVFKANSAEDFRLKMIRLLTDRLLLREMGKHSENLIYSWNFNAVVESIVALA